MKATRDSFKSHLIEGFGWGIWFSMLPDLRSKIINEAVLTALLINNQTQKNTIILLP
jgi:hypothetical protein